MFDVAAKARVEWSKGVGANSKLLSDRCGVQKVCDVEPESGTGIHDRVTLWINPGSHVDISLPP